MEPDSEVVYECNDLDSFSGATGERPKSPGVETSTWKDITLCQLRSSSMLRVAVILQDKPVQAVVDTAAAVTIISDKVFCRYGAQTTLSEEGSIAYSC